MTNSKAALAILLALGASAAHAQYGSQPSQTVPVPQPPRPAQDAPLPTLNQAPQRAYNLSRAERAALTPAIQAVERSDWAVAQTLLPAAQEAARSADAKYAVAQIQLRIGLETQNLQLQSQAIDALIASGGAQPQEMQGLYENQLEFATAAGDTAKAARALAQLDALNPNDPSRFVRMARVRVNANDPAGAIALYQQAMQAQQAAGQAIPADWRQQIVALAYGARLPQTVSYMRELLVVAPTPANWHDTLAIYAEFGNANSALKLDAYRLMRAAGAMTSERDFVEYSQAANEARAFGEVKTVLEEGLSRNLITVNTGFARERIAAVNRRMADDRASLAGERTAALAGSDGAAALRLGDAYFGYGEYAPAAELYRAALQKGGQDANLVNTRLASALALAGQRAEAQTLFRAITGPRAELAQLWLLWLSTRGG